MAAEMNAPIFLGSNDDHENPALLVAAVLHLMSHYNAADSEEGEKIKLALVIERHLKILANLPSLAPVLSATCQQLAEQWAEVISGTIAKSEKIHALSRLILGRRAKRKY